MSGIDVGATQTPRIRWAGVAFGALFTLAAGTGMLLLAVPEPFEVAGWIRPLLFSLRPEWFGAIVPLAIGLLVILLGVVWAVRRQGDSPQEPAPADTTQEP